MIWEEMKNFVRGSLPKNEDDVIKSILEFQRSLTPFKCQKYIEHLKKVFKYSKGKTTFRS